jgi:hypothetical protein
MSLERAIKYIDADEYVEATSNRCDCASGFLMRRRVNAPRLRLQGDQSFDWEIAVPTEGCSVALRP